MQGSLPSCEICVGLTALHLEAGCFHQPHTETFSPGQVFTIIWMFSGFPVSPEEILQHPVFFQQPLDSEPSTFEEIYQLVSCAEMKRTWI